MRKGERVRGKGESNEKAENDEWSDYDDESPRKERVGKQNGKAPRDNKKQNEQTDEVAKRLKLTPKQSDQLHKAVGKKGLGFQEILELAKELFNK